MDTLQHIKISEYINEADFKNKKYKLYLPQIFKFNYFVFFIKIKIFIK